LPPIISPALLVLASVDSYLFLRNLAVAEKLCLQAAQKDLRGKARERSTSEGTWAVRWSEAIECNEAYESFSAAC
jgi:hypothetical protein